MDDYLLGNKGKMIEKIQRLLNHLGYEVNIDGVYGKKTKEAVMKYQIDHQLNIDGIVGPNTLESLLLDNGNDKAYSYINSRDFYSDTKYLIYVDLSEFHCYIFKGENKNWEIVKDYLVTIGKKETPTVKGIFTVKYKGGGYSKEKEGFKVKWYTQFYHNYLFHSILFNLDGTVFDGRLGMALSDGCIRLKEEDAKFIYDNIPMGTLVVVK